MWHMRDCVAYVYTVFLCRCTTPGAGFTHATDLANEQNRHVLYLSVCLYQCCLFVCFSLAGPSIADFLVFVSFYLARMAMESTVHTTKFAARITQCTVRTKTNLNVYGRDAGSVPWFTSIVHVFPCISTRIDCSAHATSRLRLHSISVHCIP